VTWQSWIDQLRWQRLKPMEKLAHMLLDHVEGILNYCRTKVPLGVIEAVNGNIKALLRRGRGYRDMNYLLLKAQRLAATKTEFLALQKAAQYAHLSKFSFRADFSFQALRCLFSVKSRLAGYQIKALERILTVNGAYTSYDLQC